MANCYLNICCYYYGQNVEIDVKSEEYLSAADQNNQWWFEIKIVACSLNIYINYEQMKSLWTHSYHTIKCNHMAGIYEYKCSKIKPSVYVFY